VEARQGLLPNGRVDAARPEEEVVQLLQQGLSLNGQWCSSEMTVNRHRLRPGGPLRSHQEEAAHVHMDDRQHPLELAYTKVSAVVEYFEADDATRAVKM
jgi:hypothetical protein